MFRLMRDQPFRQFELMRLDELPQEISPQSSFSFVLCLGFEIGANFFPQRAKRLDLVAQTLRPIVVKLGHLFCADGADFDLVVDLLSCKALCAEILWIIDRTVLFVLGLGSI